MSSFLYRHLASEKGASVLEQVLVFVLIIPLVFLACRPIGRSVRRSMFCSAQYQVAMLNGGGSSTTEDAPEARSPDPDFIDCSVPPSAAEVATETH